MAESGRQHAKEGEAGEQPLHLSHLLQLGYGVRSVFLHYIPHAPTSSRGLIPLDKRGILILFLHLHALLKYSACLIVGERWHAGPLAAFFEHCSSLLHQ